jgi:hypothetical protein
MRTRIWTEITHTKHDIEYLRVYSLFQDKISRTLNILILVFSSSGVLSWGFFKDPKYVGISCAITAGISLIKLISPYFILSEKDTRKLDKYYSSLIHYYHLLEKFWYDCEDGNINQNKLTDEFYKISAKVNEINDRYVDLSVVHIGFLIEKAKTNSDNYFEQTFNTKIKEHE